MKNKKIKGTITLPAGFSASGIASGIKKKKKDMALLTASKGSVAAAVFTTNHLPAAPLKVSKEHLKKTNKLRSILITSGGANCATGKKGIKNAREEAELVAKVIGCKKEQVVVLSTGKIGIFLPMDKIKKGITQAANALGAKGGKDFSEAILTTDTFPKNSVYKVISGSKSYTIAGTAKGAGMIDPSMATMLGFITTDIQISASLLNEALKEAVSRSFNRINVDGCMSTNDTVIAIASGKSDAPAITKKGKGFQAFCKALESVCRDLSEMIVCDGEGMTKIIDIMVFRAENEIQAKNVAEKIDNSLLFKTAVYGESANWGRIFSSIGSAKANIREEKLVIKMCGLKVMKNGEPVRFSKSQLKKKIKKKNISVWVDLGLGKGEYSCKTVDLTPQYIRINKG